MTDNRNFIVAIVLSFAVLFGWEYFVAGPKMKAEQARQAAITHQAKAPQAGPPGTPEAGSKPTHLGRDEALKRGGARIAIQTPSLDGSLLPKGARFDDLKLKTYRQTVDPKSPEIVLFSPEGSEFPYYAQIGFVAGDKSAVPDAGTAWKQVGQGT